MMPQKNTGFDLLHWLQKNYLYIIIGFLFLYLLLSFAAPFMMKIGYQNTGKMIYRFYSYLCHQYAYRSWFLFGEQSYYPLVSVGHLKSVSETFGIERVTATASREIIGNQMTGYKVAICQRDVALYGSLLLFAVIFLISKKRIKQLSISIWFFVAVIPMGIDGTWQFISSIGFLNFMNLSHESTPLLRTITGSLFGFFSGWLLFTSIEDTLIEKK